MQGRRRKRMLSQEEEALWARATRHDIPLTRADPLPLPAEDSRPKPSAQSLPAQQESAGRLRTQTVPPGESKAQSLPAPAAPFDYREAKRIARGRRQIDGRLDLHGLRQHDAYVALKRFLAEAQARGHKHVLIITGKGNAEPSADGDFWTSGERGVLRRLVPRWLCEPAFRLHAVGFTESAPHHGGSGALYVTVRKPAAAKLKR